MIASTWKINLEIVSYLLIKVLDSFTTEFEYLVIKVSKKGGFISILHLFLNDTFFKIEREGKLIGKGTKISHPYSLTLIIWGYNLQWLAYKQKTKSNRLKRKSQFLEHETVEF